MPNLKDSKDQIEAGSFGVLRLAVFLGLIALVACTTSWIITSGLRRIKTSGFGVLNQIMEGRVNAQVVITGSSRASIQYDPRTIAAVTRRTAFNLGREGAHIDMEVAFLKTYLAHNQRPETVLHNLDAFSFVTSPKVFNPAQYLPYLYDDTLYNSLHRISLDSWNWKTRYLPMYGYAVDNMNLTWIRGVMAFFGWTFPEDHYMGFLPQDKSWTGEFDSYKANHPRGVRFEIERQGIHQIEDLIHLCQQKRIHLIFVYSPEYRGMQTLTNNRGEIFARFRELASRYNVPFWDYSCWKHSDDRNLFYNSQHLNAAGAALFSSDLAHRLGKYYGTYAKAFGSERAVAARGTE